jgi:hypothetical protein
MENLTIGNEKKKSAEVTENIISYRVKFPVINKMFSFFLSHFGSVCRVTMLVFLSPCGLCYRSL